MSPIKCPLCGVQTTMVGVQKHAEYGCPPKPQKFSFSSSSPPDLPTNKLPQASPKPADAAELASSQDSITEPTGAKKPVLSLKRSQSPTQSQKKSKLPLAEKCRPTSFAEMVGQPQLVGPHGILKQLISKGSVPSMILWGPSGVGKTTFARIIAREVDAQFVELSAPQASTADIRRVVDDAKNLWRLVRRRTILFLDEIHRFNRAQQDSLLQAVERGDIVLVGATTENPSFKVAGALLSRTRVFTLETLSEKDLGIMVDRALETLGTTIPADVRELITTSAQGDGRVALNMLETALGLDDLTDISAVRAALRATTIYDQKGEKHYDLISAFHKSVRGSDENAALYWVARMLEGGEDPLYLSRRMIRIASEDVGLADNECLPLAVATHTAVQQIGMPECDCILAHCAVRLARAPKSVRVYKALGKIKADLQADPALAAAPVPMHLRNAPTKLMKQLGYGDGYKYNPDYDGPVDQSYLPDKFLDRKWLS